jgi:flagellar hook-associated protein 3 FlgL
MRVTVSQLNRNVQHVIRNRYNELVHLQEQLSTGRRLLRPSDAPVDVANDINMTSELKIYQQYKKNINDGLSYMTITGEAMDSMNILMQKARELAVQAANDTQSAAERKIINAEVQQIFRQLITLIDTQYKGDYIFSGPQSKIPPVIVNSSSAGSVDDYDNLRMASFDASAGGVGTPTQIFNAFDMTPVTRIIPGTFSLRIGTTTYVENVDYTIDYEAGTITPLNADLAIDVMTNYATDGVRMEFDYLSKGKNVFGETVTTTGEILREIEGGIVMPINISLEEMITDYSSGNELMGMMIRFGESLLKNDQPGIERAIGELDDVFEVMLSAQTRNAARINRLETTLSRNDSQTTAITSFISELEDADMADTISKFLLAENVYKAALQSAARIIQPSLVNFL